MRRLLSRLAEHLTSRPPPASGLRLTTAIAQARDHRLVRICGRAQPDGDAMKPLLSSPLAQRPCLYYRVQVQAHHEGRWQTVLDEARFARTFLLQDSTGHALVEGRGSKQAIMGDEIWAQTPSFDGRPSPRVAALLRQRRGHRASSPPRRYRHRELCIEPGHHLWAVGLCRHEPDPDPRSASTYRHRSPRVRLLAPWFGVLRVGVVASEEAVRG